MPGKTNRAVHPGERSSSISALPTQATDEKMPGEDLAVHPGERSSSISALPTQGTDETMPGEDLAVHPGERSSSISALPTQGTDETMPDLEDKEEEESTFDVVLSQLLNEECHEIKELAEAWIRTYESSKFEALRAMLELILHSTGALQTLTKEQALKLDKLSADTFNAWMSNPQVEPLISYDLFLNNFLNFLKITLVGDVCLDDIFIMKRILYLLNVFTSSTWVSARYTSLMIGSLITSQYIKFWSELNAMLHNELVTENEINLSEKVEVAKIFFHDFIEVVILCLRDYHLPIRKCACKIYFNWCLEEQLLITDSYLRYVFWALLDDSESIRSLAIVTCDSLYKSEYVVKNAEGFIKKTLPAIVKRAQDVNNHVAAVALETISRIQRETPWLLKDISLDPIFILIYGDDWKATKASEFIHNVVEDMSRTNVEFIFNTVVFTEESLASLEKHLDEESAVGLLVENLFSHSRLELTDWAAWRLLLLGNILDRLERLHQVACLLLVKIINYVSICSGDRYFVEATFPPAPSIEENKTSAGTNCRTMNEKLKVECLNDLVQMTSILGKELSLLLEKYKHNLDCLTKLCTIPQYFNGKIDSLDIKRICFNLTYLRNRLCSSISLEAVHRSLACIHHLMLTSHKWKSSIPKFEHILFEKLPEKFLNSCARLANQSTQKHVQTENLRVIKQVFFLSKFFDVTKTCLLDDAISALKFGTANRNAAILCPTIQICLYILKWQLKHVIEGNLAEDKTARLYKIQSHSRTLVIQLEYLISSQNSLVRETVYSEMCWLFGTFSRYNVYTTHYPLIHLPRPSLDVMEWLNYGLACQVPKDKIPEDEKEFQMSCNALQKFCSLLKVQAVHLTYVNSILYYFKFYHLPRNYNSILESTFRHLFRLDTLVDEVVDSLMWMKLNTNCNVEEITKGICAVALTKLPSTKFIQQIAYDIVYYGLSQIKNPSHHFVFQILAHFVKLLETNDAKSLFSEVVDVFNQYLETDTVKAFLAAFNPRSEVVARMLQISSVV